MKVITWWPACVTCDAIARPGEYVSADGDDRPSLAGFLEQHMGSLCQLQLLSPAEVNRLKPRAGWSPRPVFGPPLPGEAQDVVCPVCDACGGSDRGDQVTWKRTEAGDPLVFCRSCGFTWGPGADADRSRMLLRSIGERRSPLP